VHPFDFFLKLDTQTDVVPPRAVARQIALSIKDVAGTIP
jgi:hypothetical protein